jgi:oxygen-independent coproporphyrinogen-3 oxidase
VQDFNLQVQEAINRVQSEEITRQTVEWARELGFKSVNLDLIYGLPYQTLNSFAETVEKIIDISPNRIAVFNYAHVPWLKKHQNVIPPEALPSPDERLNIFKMTIEKLIGAGYEYIGLDHFAKPTDELAIAQKNNTLYRNFQGYSTKAGCDVYAFGLSAISQFQNIYAQNLKNLKDYYRFELVSVRQKQFKEISTRAFCLRRRKKLKPKPRKFCQNSVVVRDTFLISDTAFCRKRRLKTPGILSTASRN